MRRPATRTQMGPAAGGNPYIQSVRGSNGWLEVGLRRGLAELPQRVHVVCLFDDGEAHVIHEGIKFPRRTKRATARFKPKREGTALAFEPVVHVPDDPPRRVLEASDDLLPTWIELQVLNAGRTSQEFDSLAARIETPCDGDGLSVTELAEQRSLSGRNA